MKKVLITIMAASMMSLAGTASAELFINPADKAPTGKAVAGVDYTSSKADYELTDEWDAELERKILSATVAYGVSDAVDVFATFGDITDSSFGDIPTVIGEDADFDGGGSLYAFGVRGVLPASGDTSLHLYGQYLSTSEEVSCDPYDVAPWIVKEEYKYDMTEISVGMVAAFEADKFTGYAAGEYVVSSKGDGDRKVFVDGTHRPGADLDVDAERDEKIILRLGGKYDAGNGIAVNAGLTVSGESTASLGVSKAF